MGRRYSACSQRDVRGAVHDALALVVPTPARRTTRSCVRPALAHRDKFSHALLGLEGVHVAGRRGASQRRQRLGQPCRCPARPARSFANTSLVRTQDDRHCNVGLPLPSLPPPQRANAAINGSQRVMTRDVNVCTLATAPAMSKKCPRYRRKPASRAHHAAKAE